MDSKGWILTLPPNADTMHSHAVHPVALKSECSPRKRVALKMEGEKRTIGKENEVIARPLKKVKKLRADAGMLRGRPILQDIVNGEK
jgi:DNA replication ATP-dependent helicase Dna2